MISEIVIFESLKKWNELEIPGQLPTSASVVTQLKLTFNKKKKKNMIMKIMTVLIMTMIIVDDDHYNVNTTNTKIDINITSHYN